MLEKQPAVYILASKRNGTLYIGVTSNLRKRIWEHKNDLVEGFTKTYQVHTLVYFEMHENMTTAIMREKQLKKWNRAWKLQLIERHNPEWTDLWQEIVCTWIPACAGMTGDGLLFAASWDTTPARQTTQARTLDEAVAQNLKELAYATR
jgi:putative endonuclease